MMLPQGWMTAPIGDLCSLINGKAFKPADWAREGRPIIRIQNLNRPDAEYNYCDAEVDARFLVEPGELLFAWSGTPGTSFGAHIWNGPTAVLNQHIFRVRFDENLIEKEFFRRAINAKLEELINKAHGGVGLAHVTKGKFEATEVVLPPSAEQHRIVTKLDVLTAHLSRTRTELDRVPVLAHRYRMQAIRAAFETGVGTPTSLIDSLCKVGTGSTPKRGERRYYDGGTIPWITSGAVNAGLVTESTELITAAAIKETNCKTFPAGSLVVALYGEGKTRGKVATLGLEAATNQALAVLHSFDHARIDPEWIRLFLQARYEQTRAEAAGGVQPNLNLGIVKAIQIPTPPIDEQRSAIKQLHAAFARAERLEAEAARARVLLDRLEAAILAKAFRGELVPQDPNDEPASALLDRIRAQRAVAPKPKRGRKIKGNADA